MLNRSYLARHLLENFFRRTFSNSDLVQVFSTDRYLCLGRNIHVLIHFFYFFYSAFSDSENMSLDGLHRREF